MTSMALWLLLSRILNTSTATMPLEAAQCWSRSARESFKPSALQVFDAFEALAGLVWR